LARVSYIHSPHSKIHNKMYKGYVDRERAAHNSAIRLGDGNSRGTLQHIAPKPQPGPGTPSWKEHAGNSQPRVQLGRPPNVTHVGVRDPLVSPNVRPSYPVNMAAPQTRPVPVPSSTTSPRKIGGPSTNKTRVEDAFSRSTLYDSSSIRPPIALKRTGGVPKRSPPKGNKIIQLAKAFAGKGTRASAKTPANPRIQVEPDEVEHTEPIDNVDFDNDYTVEVVPDDQDDDGVSGDPLKCVDESGGTEELHEETFPDEEEDLIMDYDLGNAGGLLSGRSDAPSDEDDHNQSDIVAENNSDTETVRIDLNILSVDEINVLGGQRDVSKNLEQSATKVNEESPLVETTEEENSSTSTTSSFVNHTDEQLPLEAAKLTSNDNNIAEQSTLLIENGVVDMGIEAGRNVGENEDSEVRSDGNEAVINDVQNDLATGNAAQPQDDEGPPDLTKSDDPLQDDGLGGHSNAEIPSLPCMGRKTSRKAQLATEVRLEGHIEFEEYVTVVPAHYSVLV
jgi:hypothetical protein